MQTHTLPLLTGISTIALHIYPSGRNYQGPRAQATAFFVATGDRWMTQVGTAVWFQLPRLGEHVPNRFPVYPLFTPCVRVSRELTDCKSARLQDKLALILSNCECLLACAKLLYWMLANNARLHLVCKMPFGTCHITFDKLTPGKSLEKLWKNPGKVGFTRLVNVW